MPRKSSTTSKSTGRKTASKPPARRGRQPASKPARRGRTPKPKPQPAPMEDMIETEDMPEVDDSTMADRGLAIYSDTPAIDASDLFIPRLRLAQGLTQEVQEGVAKPGQWLVLGEDPMEDVEVVIVGMSKRRELRDPDTRIAVCRSSDAVTGLGNPGGDCASCELSHWSPSNKKNASNNPPACNFLYSYMVYIVDTQSMAILEFSRTSITTGKMINTMLLQRGGMAKFILLLSSSSKQGPKGTYYAPMVSLAEMDEEIIEEALKASRMTM